MKKVILLILDGWGYTDKKEHNAVYLSNPKHFNLLTEKKPNMLLNASEESVGLPKGQMGNSEVGHTNIGAGRVVYQDFLKISLEIESGKVAQNENIIKFFNNVKQKSNRLHLMGLLSDGGVHSHIDHFKGIIKLAKSVGVKDIFLHIFTDGRDTPPDSGLGFVTDIEKWLKAGDIGKIADVTGRYYAMDRDKRWDRVKLAWDVLRNGKSEFVAENAIDAVKNAYKRKETDEFIKPTKIANVDGTLKDDDGVFMVNFRADRVRELVHVMVDKNFEEFDRGATPSLDIFTLTEYDKSFGLPIAYPPADLEDILGEVVSNNGLKQLRIAETEKYAHVTYFFNGGREEPFKNEERKLIASPRDVATYDLKPEMSVYEVTKNFEEIFKKGDIDFVVMNFANPDMVGHTGVEEAAINACKAVDESLGKIIKVADEMDAVLIVCADHGNSEQMWDYETNQPYTAHTLNPVRFIIHNYECKLKNKIGKLADIAPTILHILGISQPNKMDGECLIEE